MPRLRGVQAICMAMILCLPHESVSASSRFEAGEPHLLQSRAVLDFTIIIPEFVWLHTGSKAQAEQEIDGQGSQLGARVPRTSNVTGNGGAIVPAYYSLAGSDAPGGPTTSSDAAKDFAVAIP